MEKVYFALIMKGLKGIEDVPSGLRPVVQALLDAAK